MFRSPPTRGDHNLKLNTQVKTVMTCNNAFHGIE